MPKTKDSNPDLKNQTQAKEDKDLSSFSVYPACVALLSVVKLKFKNKKEIKNIPDFNKK